MSAPKRQRLPNWTHPCAAPVLPTRPQPIKMENMHTVLDSTTVPQTRLLYQLAVLLAAISGIFCVIFCAVLLIYYHGLLAPHNATLNASTSEMATSGPPYRKPANDSFNRLPTDYPSFLALRQALAQNKQDETLKTQIRKLDQELRSNYFHRRSVLHWTTHFLILSSILFFAAVRTAGTLKRQIPNPDETHRQSEKKSSAGFAVVAAWLMLCAGLYLGLLFTPPIQVEKIILDKLVAEWESANDGRPTTDGRQQTADDRRQREELFAKNWISFRNFNGNGVGFSDNPPIHWDGQTGENILWKSEVPLPGNSSPVIWEDKLFLTGADEHTQKVFCYNIDNGELLWTADVTLQEEKEIDEFGDTGFAAPTPVVDGRHVYAMFANGELVAVDLTGKLVWRKSFGVPDSHYGFASSPALCFDKLIVQFDVGSGDDDGDEEDNGKATDAKLVALSLDTGEVLWETSRRGMPNSWSSPTVNKIADSYQIITCGTPFVIAYNPDNGKEIWRCHCLNGDVGPSAVVLGNVVMVTNQGPQTTAIDATGTGDITETHILWKGANALPSTPSPLVTEKYFLTVEDYGIMTGYDPNEVGGKRAKFWELEVSDVAYIYSSPIRVGTYVYIFDKTQDNSRAFVIDLSKIDAVVSEREITLTEESVTAMRVAENPMPEPVVTSPAVLNNRLYVRGATTIYCIGE